MKYNFFLFLHGHSIYLCAPVTNIDSTTIVKKGRRERRLMLKPIGDPSEGAVGPASMRRALPWMCQIQMLRSGFVTRPRWRQSVEVTRGLPWLKVESNFQVLRSVNTYRLLWFRSCWRHWRIFYRVYFKTVKTLKPWISEADIFFFFFFVILRLASPLSLTNCSLSTSLAACSSFPSSMSWSHKIWSLSLIHVSVFLSSIKSIKSKLRMALRSLKDFNKFC